MKVIVFSVSNSDTDECYIELSNRTLLTMGWESGDILKVEPVVDRDGKVIHAILEKVQNG